MADVVFPTLYDIMRVMSLSHSNHAAFLISDFLPDGSGLSTRNFKGGHLINFYGGVNGAHKPEGCGKSNGAGDKEKSEACESHVTEIQKIRYGKVRLQPRKVQARVPEEKMGHKIKRGLESLLVRVYLVLCRDFCRWERNRIKTYRNMYSAVDPLAKKLRHHQL